MSSPRANPLPSGSQSITPKKRCAVYTRKSTDEGLDQEYNSLEAQRDAGLAFIASQRHEGWIAMGDGYDDVEHRVLVRGSNDFEYQGQRFKSLSAIAGRITGSHWSVPVFFGLKTPATKKVTA